MENIKIFYLNFYHSSNDYEKKLTYFTNIDKIHLHIDKIHSS